MKNFGNQRHFCVLLQIVRVTKVTPEAGHEPNFMGQLKVRKKHVLLGRGRARAPSAPYPESTPGTTPTPNPRSQSRFYQWTQWQTSPQTLTPACIRTLKGPYPTSNKRHFLTLWMKFLCFALQIFLCASIQENL